MQGQAFDGVGGGIGHGGDCQSAANALIEALSVRIPYRLRQSWAYFLFFQELVIYFL